jgi:hypothetical protein
MKGKIIKGPNFEKVEEEAYKYLSKVLREKGIEFQKKIEKEQEDNK